MCFCSGIASLPKFLSTSYIPIPPTTRCFNCGTEKDVMSLYDCNIDRTILICADCYLIYYGY